MKEGIVFDGPRKLKSVLKEIEDKEEFNNKDKTVLGLIRRKILRFIKRRSRHLNVDERLF